MPLQLALSFLSSPIGLALLSSPQIRGFFGKTFGGLFRGGAGQAAAGRAPVLQSPEQFGGRAFTGAGAGIYGHAVGGRGEPSFTLPGPGGGSVMIPELVRAAQGGDAFARGAIGAQAASAERFRDIDALLDIMREQARAGGMPDPFATSGPTSVGGAGLY